MRRSNRTIRLLSTLVALSVTLSAVLVPGAMACMLQLAHAAAPTAHHAQSAEHAPEMPAHCGDHSEEQAPSPTSEEAPDRCAMQLCVSPSTAPAATAEQSAPQYTSVVASPQTVVVELLPVPFGGGESSANEARTLPAPDLSVLHASFLI